MADASVQARLAAARRALGNALGAKFQPTITYRQGMVDYAEYDDNGRLVRATMTVDGVANVPVIAGAGEALHVGDSIQVQNRGTPASPMYKYDYHLASSYADAGTSPAATLPTPTGLSLVSTWRAANAAAIFASWTALSEMVMGSAGYYELMIRRDDEVDGHVSRCPHFLPSTTLDGPATAGDTTIAMVSTEGFPATGSVKIGDAWVTFTDRTSTEISGCTWLSGSGTYDSGTGVTALTQSFVFENLLVNTGYNVKVRAVSNGAVSDWSAWASITTSLPAAPGTPEISISAVQGGFEVSWSEELEATSYTLEWATDGSGSNAETKFVGNALYKHIAADGSHAYFRVKASGFGGDSAFCAWETDTTAPGAPTNGSGTVTPAGFVIGWSAPAASAEVKEYVVYSDDNVGGTSKTERWRGNALESATIAYGTDEYFWVGAVGYNGAISTLLAIGQVDPTPATPTITVQAVEGGFQVSWTAQANAAGYTLQWATSGAGADSAVQFTGNALYKFVAADGSHVWFQVKATGFDATSSAYCAWATDSAAPPTPTGFTASDGAGKVTVAVALGTDTSHSATGFKEWELQQSDTGTGGGTNVVNLPALKVSGGVATMDVILAPGTTKYYRIRAVDWAGNASAYTSWDAATSADTSVVEHPVQDKFDMYGGTAFSPLESLSWLAVSDFEPGAGLGGYDNWVGSGGVKSANTTVGQFVEGSQGMRVVSAAPDSAAVMNTHIQHDWSQEARFGLGDYASIFIYTPDASKISNLHIDFMFTISAGNYSRWSPTLVNGVNHLRIKRSDLVEAGSINWADVAEVAITWTAAAGADITFDALRIVKADPAIAATYNNTGSIWDFLPQQGSGSEWPIYPGARTGEPSKPFSLGQIYTAASPTNWLLGWHTQSYVSAGLSLTGAYLKGADGEIAYAFNIKDAAVATRTCYAVELNSATDTISLVKWVNGTRTVIATATSTPSGAFTLAPNEGVWFGAKWDASTIQVYVSKTEGTVDQASNLAISVTDTSITRGGFVGVMSKECNCRFFYFRAGSPAHAMSAEYSYRSAVVDPTGKYLTGEIKIWPSASLPNVATEGAWLLCNGAAYNQADYPALYAVIGTTFGAGGAGTFKVPDFRDNSPQGASATDAIAAVVGVKTQTGVPEHRHQELAGGAGVRYGAASTTAPKFTAPSTANLSGLEYTGYTGTAGGVDQRGPRLAVNFIIKT